MKTDERSSRRLTLKDWEEWLAPQVRQVELLGEISISADECAQLGQVIGLRARSLGHSRALRTLRRDYPCALAVYLVAQGVYGYQGGDYWSEVVQVTGLNRNYTWRIGQAFEDILVDLGLPLFPDLRAKAHRYVSLILAHGGIPDYCLDDFFKNMLQPSVLRDRYADLSIPELIEEWSTRSSVQYVTDKPVLRFLAYGGQVAEDFVRRCREMAWETLDAGVVPDAEELGLPKRVVEAYDRWIAEQGADQVTRDRTDRWRLRKPQILVDPWGEGVILDLPPQQVPATKIYAEISWRVTVGEEEIQVPVRVRRTGYDLKTEEQSLLLRWPAPTYQVSLLADGEVKRTWSFPGVTPERPLLVFDPDKGTLLNWKHSLPARQLGLLHPAHLNLRIEGKPALLETLPRLPWGWAGFRGSIWDLSGATQLRLMQEDDVVLSATLRPDEAAQRPYLQGGRPLSADLSSTGDPVYVGTPPFVRIPLRPRSGQPSVDSDAPQAELARWRLMVRHKWSADPEVHATETLDALRSDLVVGARHVDLPLGLPSLLGEAPCGNYRVRLRGPLGRDAEFTLRTVPHLAIMGHEALYLPHPQSGPRPARLLIETRPGDVLEYQGQEEECRVQLIERNKDSWLHEAQVGPDVTRVELTVVHHMSCQEHGTLPSEETVRVPVPVSIRRLRWALVGEQTTAGRREWTGHVIKRPVDALLQVRSPWLLVELPLQDIGEGQVPRRGDQILETETTARLALRLLNVDGEELQRIDIGSSSRDQRLWRFDLSAFLDTLRASRSPILRFELVVWNLPERDEVLQLPVLSLTRTLVVDEVALARRRVDDRVAVELTWHEPVRLRNRHVRFWPLWRPWEPVFERAIPNDAEGSFSFDVSAKELGPGKYRVEFLVIDPWAPPVASKPTKDAPSSADIALVPPEERLRTLNAELQEKKPRFELFLERAAIGQDVGDFEQAQADRQWCYEHLDEGTIPQIIALIELVEASEDRDRLRPLQLKMFAASRVERLFLARDRGGITPEHFRTYLRHLPRSGLLPQSTCEQLLSVEDERVRLHALQQLIRRGTALGVDKILEWVSAARLSDDDALALFSVNPDFAIDCLRERVDDSISPEPGRTASREPSRTARREPRRTARREPRRTARRLLDALSRTVEDVVRVGDWVRCDLGWGRVKRIESLDRGTQVNWCLGGRSQHQLTVALHPDVEPERMVVDLASASANFLNDGMIMLCSECEAFSTQKLSLMEQHFETVHPPRTKKQRKNRGNVYAAFLRIEEMPIPLTLLEFSSEPPSDD